MALINATFLAIRLVYCSHFLELKCPLERIGHQEKIVFHLIVIGAQVVLKGGRCVADLQSKIDYWASLFQHRGPSLAVIDLHRIGFCFRDDKAAL